MLKKIYKIAEHLVEVDFSDDIASVIELSNFAPFEVVCGECDPLFKCVFSRNLTVDFNSTVKIADFNGDSVNISAFNCDGGSCVKLMTDRGADVADIKMLNSSSVVETCILCEDDQVLYAINNVLMLLFTNFTANSDTILMHSSVVMYRGKGYMFLGKSGTGKSTQSRMWLENIADTELLNDDNPAVRIVDGVATVYGTPWSGKTPCYKNMSVPVGGVVRIRRAVYNRIERLRVIKAYASLIPSCSCIKWNRECELGVSKTVENVVQLVGVYDLECLPNGDAARCCCEGVTK